MKYINALKNFFVESYQELQKATWLSKKEVAASTIGIIIIVIIVSVYIGVVDFILSRTFGAFVAR